MTTCFAGLGRWAVSADAVLNTVSVVVDGKGAESETLGPRSAFAQLPDELILLIRMTDGPVKK